MHPQPQENPSVDLSLSPAHVQADPPSTPQQQGLSIQEMAARITAFRRSFPHLSANPLSGNSLY